jgi:hypothetical protein
MTPSLQIVPNSFSHQFDALYFEILRASLNNPQYKACYMAPHLNDVWRNIQILKLLIFGLHYGN